MPTFKDKKGKSHYHMNPQMGHARFDETDKEEKLEEDIHPGIHEKVKEAEEKGLAHHVEVHHGGHAHGEPPAHEGHTHHTITHGHDGSEQIHNHEDYDSAEAHTRQAMHGEEETEEPSHEEGGGEEEY